MTSSNNSQTPKPATTPETGANVSGSSSKSGKPHPKVKFSPEEDFRLRAIIMRFGDNDWNLIASLMKDRNPRQCRERWLKYLAPNVRFEPWSQDEDRQLERLVRDFGQKWVKISRFFRNRTDINVKNRWLVLQRQKAKSALTSSSSSTSTPPETAETAAPMQHQTQQPQLPNANNSNVQISIGQPLVQPILNLVPSPPSPPQQIPMPIISPVLNSNIQTKVSNLDLSSMDMFHLTVKKEEEEEDSQFSGLTEIAAVGSGFQFNGGKFSSPPMFSFLSAGSNNLEMEIWDGMMPPAVIEFDTPMDSFSGQWN